MNTILARVLWVVAYVGGKNLFAEWYVHVNRFAITEANLAGHMAFLYLACVSICLLVSVPYMNHLNRHWTNVFYLLIPFAAIYFLFCCRRMTLAEQAANKAAEQSELEYQRREKPSAYDPVEAAYPRA